MRTLSISHKVLALLVSGALLSGWVMAQDEFSIPGVDDPAPAAGAAAGSGAPVGAADSAAAASGPAQYTNFLDKLIGNGGWAIWPLLVMSVLLVGLSAFLIIDLGTRNFCPTKLVKQFREDMEQNDVQGALDRGKKSSTCLGQMMYGASDYIADRGYQVLDDHLLYDSMADASQEFNRGRAGTITWISVIAQAAPMVGLLGTVSGMIKAFDFLGQKGMGDPGQLASFIAEALWTTASGLVIAVPALAIYYFFRGRLAKQVALCDQHAFKLLNTLRRTVVSKSS